MAYRVQNGYVVLTRVLPGDRREELLLPPEQIDAVIGTARENEAFLYSFGGRTPRTILLEDREYRGLCSVLTDRHYRIGERGIVRADSITLLAEDTSYGMAGSVYFPVEMPYRGALREGYGQRGAAAHALSRPENSPARSSGGKTTGAGEQSGGNGKVIGCLAAFLLVPGVLFAVLSDEMDLMEGILGWVFLLVIIIGLTAGPVPISGSSPAGRRTEKEEEREFDYGKAWSDIYDSNGPGDVYVDPDEIYSARSDKARRDVMAEAGLDAEKYYKKK